MTDYVFETKDGFELVYPEKWQWVARYDDGSELKQFEDRPFVGRPESGTFHQFREIDQSKLHIFSMVNGDKSVDVLFDPKTMKLIHFYRRFRLNAFTPEEVTGTVYVFGYEKDGQKSTLFILPNDTIGLTDDPNNLRV